MKFIASDFDETIYLMDDEITTKENVTAIKDFISKGNSFCIISGRNYTDIKVLLNDLDIPYTYLICEDGAKIFNSVDQCLDTTYLDKDEIEEIIKILDEEEYDYYLDDGYNKTENKDDTVKIVINCKDRDEALKIEKNIKSKIDIHIYASRTHVNIIHKTVNKKNGLEKLFYLEDLDFNNLYVIGDNDNDYEMLQKFKGGVITNHHKILDELNKKEFDSLHEFIEYVEK